MLLAAGSKRRKKKLEGTGSRDFYLEYTARGRSVNKEQQKRRVTHSNQKICASQSSRRSTQTKQNQN